MMRTSLLHPLGERRHTRRSRSRRGAQTVQPQTLQREADPELERAREAGGPIDQASYACDCGYTFLAPVSTTVACPHCHVTQAW